MLFRKKQKSVAKEKSSVSTKELEQLMTGVDVAIIDVREPDEYAAGHIK